MSAWSWLRLLRAGTLFSPAADIVAGCALAGLPFSLATARLAAASVLVYAGGMVLNDVFDLDEDRVRRPERPLPRAEIRVGDAFAAGAALLVAGALLERAFALLAVLVVAYDLGVKRSAVCGPLLMGSLRALNLLVPAALTAAPSLSGPQLAAGIGYGVAIASVTVLGSLEDSPKPDARAVRAAASIPPLAASLGLLAQPRLWFAGLLLLLALPTLLRAWRLPSFDTPSIRRLMTHLLLGTMLYTSCLAGACGEPLAAGAILAVVPLARWVSRSIALT